MQSWSDKAFVFVFALCATSATCQTTISYYFPHIAAADVWRTTFTLVNAGTLAVNCSTTFRSDSGGSLALSFNGSPLQSISDTIPPGGTVRHQTDAQPSQPLVTGWAVASCSGPVKASALFRSFSGSTPTGEASVLAAAAAAARFVTYADQSTGVAYANPSGAAASLTFTARDTGGSVLGSTSLPLAAGAHGAQNVGPLLGIKTFQGSITITSTVPIVSLSLNAEASPVLSSLPPGEDDPTPGPATYHFAHIAAADVWRTTFTLVNASAQPISCTTSFFNDSGAPLALSFNGTASSTVADSLAPGGIARHQTDALPGQPVITGWAVANCTGPIKASSLFRRFNGAVAVAEASVIAMAVPASSFVGYADQLTGLAWANPGTTAANVNFRALDLAGAPVGSVNLTVAPGAHSAANLGPLLSAGNFQGSVVVTASQPIVSLSLNAEASPEFSSLPRGEGYSFEIYGAWHCSNDSCRWRTVRDVTSFDATNHWLIDRGDGSGLPSVNLVVLSFVQPTKLLALTNDSQTVNGIPIAMTQAIVNYFTTHNVRVMLSVGGATFISDWDQALASDPAALALHAANVAKAMGVGIEIDYENQSNPDLAHLDAFIRAYRAIMPYDPTGTNAAARLTIDLAAGDRSLVDLCRKATADWLSGDTPLLDFANATVPNGQPDAATAESNWREHVNGRTNVNPAVPPLTPSRFTAAVRLINSGTVQPECSNFATSLQNTTGVFAQTVAPNGAGATPGILGYMFWGAEAQAPATCENGVGSGAKTYNIPLPMPPLRRR
jgi:hypothetical protein